MTKDEAQTKLADAIDLLATAGIKVASVANSSEFHLASTLAGIDQRIQAAQADLTLAFHAL